MAMKRSRGKRKMQATLNSAELTQPQFQTISSMVKGLCGINLHDGKKALIKARLGKRLRTLGLRDFGQYLDRIRDDADGDETCAMLDALATNLTYFFREPGHFDFLRTRVLPALRARRRQERRLRIWSAGCSSGEEAYSIAITLRDAMADLPAWDVGILGTDISTPMLRLAVAGVYGRDRLRQTPAHLVQEGFRCEVERGRTVYRVHESVRRMVHFARLNLMAAWPMRGQFDVIFCRNVMIYFDKPTQERLIERFHGQLAPGGTLLIGHSESLTGIRHALRYVQPTVYEKE
jgi:chemotaxis protein methyltransferase CheR